MSMSAFTKKITPTMFGVQERSENTLCVVLHLFLQRLLHISCVVARHCDPTTRASTRNGSAQLCGGSHAHRCVENFLQ